MDAKTLALYLGCRVKVLNDKRDGILMGIFISRKITWAPEGRIVKEIPIAIIEHDEQINNFEIHDVALVLRPLSSMTEEDFIDCKVMSEKLVRGFGDQQKLKFKVDGFGGFTIYKTDAYVTQWLLSKGFDLFGLLEKGEAIDATKVEKLNEI